MRQKGFAPILIIILVLIAIGGAYYFGTKKGNIIPTPTQSPVTVASNAPAPITPTTKPTTDPTANWKTYENNVYHYSFKYPPSWAVRAFQYSDNSTSDPLKTSYLILSSEGVDKMYFSLTDPLINPTLEDGYISTNKYGKPISYYKVFPNGEGPDDRSFVTFQTTGRKDTITINVLSSFPIPYEQDQILSTFKFTQ